MKKHAGHQWAVSGTPSAPGAGRRPFQSLRARSAFTFSKYDKNFTFFPFGFLIANLRAIISKTLRTQISTTGLKLLTNGTACSTVSGFHVRPEFTRKPQREWELAALARLDWLWAGACWGSTEGTPVQVGSPDRRSSLRPPGSLRSTSPPCVFGKLGHSERGGRRGDGEGKGEMS